MTIDLGVRFTATAGAELAALIEPARPDCVASVATLGIPVALEVSRALGLDDYLILQKSPKIHLRDAQREPVQSITSAGTQHLLLDRARIPAVRGRRVAFVDDVISTGASSAAAALFEPDPEGGWRPRPASPSRDGRADNLRRMAALGKSAARSIAALVGAAALVIAVVGAGPARAVSVAGSGGPGRPAATAATSPTAPCDFTGTVACASADPKVKIYAAFSGDASSCTFSWVISWGDGSSPQTVVLTDPPTGTDLLAGHAFPVTTQKKYPITADPTVTAGSCTATGETLAFTLLAYVALGDSYSSGDGDGGYQAGTGFSGNECLRSAHAYPELLAGYLGDSKPNAQNAKAPAFAFRPCTGAVIADFGRSQRTATGKTVPAQLSFLRGQSSQAGLVTFTIGGNDAGFEPVMAYCATRTAKQPSCQKHSGKAVKTALATLDKRLIALYKQVRQAPRVAGNATIIAVGYPRFFPLKQAKSCPTGDPGHVFRPDDMAWINAVIGQADAKIAAAAKSAGITYASAYAAFGGHELCQSRPDLFYATLPEISSFHPTAAGQAALAAVIEKQLRLTS